MNTSPLVSVCMITYGHEDFILKAVHSVLDQETEFPFELVIANDCSPDETDSIIKMLIETHLKGNIIKYHKHSENIGMMRNFAFALNECVGKYIALCEGDDYWFHRSKMQIQVEFLESHLDYVLVGHNAKFNRNGIEDHKVVRHVPNSYIDVTTSDLIKKNPFVSSMVMFRNIGFEEIMFILEHFIVGDKALFTLLSFEGLGRMYQQPVGFYRKHDNSVTSRNRIEYKAFRDDLINRINHASYWNTFANNRFESELKGVLRYRSKVITTMALREFDILTALRFSRYVHVDDLKNSRLKPIIIVLRVISQLLYPS